MVSDTIIYSQDDPPYNLSRRQADGTGEPELLIETPVDYEARSISPDGKSLMYSTSGLEICYDLWVVELDGDRQPEPWLTTPFNEDFGAFSPDGNWVAYQSNETDTSQVYVNRFPAGGRKLQVSIDGGTRPLWSNDGRELFRGSYMTTSNRQDYDVAADGRFVMIKTPDEEKPREITVVLNWFQELESLVPSP